MSRFSWLPYMRSRSSDLGQSQQVTQEPIQQVLDNASSSETENQPMDFDSIADRVEQLQEELFYAQDLCEQADLQISKYRTDIHELKYTIATLEHAIVGLRTNEAKNALAQARHEKKEVKRAVTAMKSLQARCDTQTVMMKAMGKHAQDSEQKYKELKFDFELYKCTMNPGLDCLHTADPNSPLPAQPFVVVLVDGDAYQWSQDFTINSPIPIHGQMRPSTDTAGAGGLAASRLKNEVVKYIVNGDCKIPPSAKIVTRVFCNFGGLERHVAGKGIKPTGIVSRDFAVQFTAKLPLFDYFDCGSGKEKADDRIRENFNLYLSTPNCHAIFLAACLDNGFARMLEQYTDHPTAHDKIVLVSPGHVAIEIFRLQFKTVVWTNVFAPAQISPKQTNGSRTEHLRQEQMQRRKEMQQAHVEAQYGLSYGAQTQLAMKVPRWDINNAIARASGYVGVRSAQPQKLLGMGEKSNTGERCVPMTDEEID